MTSEPVSASDLFQCKNCGGCCKGYGGTFVTEKDIRAISEFINADPESFVEKYCRMSGNRPVLAQGKNGYCVFWKDLCTIHDVKPRMCRAWPFIKPVLKDIKNWEIMAAACPGICTDAAEGAIKKRVREEIKNINRT